MNVLWQEAWIRRMTTAFVNECRDRTGITPTCPRDAARVLLLVAYGRTAKEAEAEFGAWAEQTYIKRVPPKRRKP